QKKIETSQVTAVEKEEKIPASSLKEEKPPIKEEKLRLEAEKPKTGGPIPVKVSGEVVASLGFTPSDTYWKRANADLNEKNWRILSTDAMNNKYNSYDPSIYDRVRVNAEGKLDDSLSFYSNVTMDPWSFIGKSDKFTVRGATGDEAEVQLKYWSNTGYTVNETIYTNTEGDSFNLPELKVINSETDIASIRSLWGNTFTIPSQKIHRELWPIREFWLDYVPDNEFKFRFFPVAYENQALTTDDPIGLSNHHIWWEESPWLSRWKPGNLNTGTTPVDFTKGKWDDSLAFFTKDSDGTRLTSLRGFAASWIPTDSTELSATLAAPKELWQDYESFDTLALATRLKHLVTDNFRLGGTYTLHSGLNEESFDAVNNVFGADTAFSPAPSFKLATELASSFSDQDSSSSYKTRKRGNAYYLSLIASSPRDNILDLKYEEIKPDNEDIFFKSRLLLARMDDSFDPSLSNFRETRDDTFWSRHLHFRKPMEFSKFYTPSMSYYDIEPFRLGDGVDSGRNVIGLRTEVSLLDKRLQGLGDIRNVYSTEHKYIETVARTEWDYQIDPKWKAKTLFLNHDLPKTKGGKDPFIFDPATDTFYNNSIIPDGEDPSLRTGSLGLEYTPNDFWSIYGIYEYTNDITLGTDNFPRGAFNGASMTTYEELTTFEEAGKIFRGSYPFLYNQGFFPVPPYPYYDIYKLGLSLRPRKDVELLFTGTRNVFEHAGPIDDNMNHVGFELSYVPTEKLGFYFKYTLSFWNDMFKIAKDSDVEYGKHHNIFTEIHYMIDKDGQLAIQYGVGGVTPVNFTSYDPFGGSLQTVDTQHILRLYYRRVF
ncbi:MAG: hypothetical protein PHI86_03605, partial [Candidatus Omnitrophica bacterium]|nr:hypothetical protein [Candidatus Omnitrophota bacterium]